MKFNKRSISGQFMTISVKHLDAFEYNKYKLVKVTLCN